MHSQDIRRAFLHYFKRQGHTLVPSSPVVPYEDPTLLFTNAGMNQFKDVFLGKSVREYTRAASSQKCIRVGGKHNDLDNVGHTSRHLTFFEMLGNFSFGDYFKKEAIAFAWEVTTQIFQLPKEKLWITVFEKDDEAFSLWETYMPKERIVRLGEKDNFWAMGETGPCGPCSELLFDRGETFGSARSPKEDTGGERYFEFWNLVFMQFNRDTSGHTTSLPKQSIDTGAGLERVVSLKMGVSSLFETDILRSLIAQTEEVSKKNYAPTQSDAPAFRVIADHIRSLAFAIAEGAQPSNIERGYVLRKLIRRAVRYGRNLGMQEPFLAKILPRLVDVMGSDYPELKSAETRIAEILSVEEEAFFRTLKRGGALLNQVIEKAHVGPLKQITGNEAFKLKDTYGLPLEEILLIAKDSGLTVNLETYSLLEEEAKEKSKSAHVSASQEAEENLFKDFAKTHGECVFTGYTQTEGSACILAIVVGGRFVEQLEEGKEALILLNQTPFYAEKGGQVADTGALSHASTLFTVRSCQNPYPQVIVHSGLLEKGSLRVGMTVHAAIDAARRTLIASHHSATHLLHFALHHVLGEHIRQAGSLVEPHRLRFDFNHHKPLSFQELRTVEMLVNEKVREDKDVKAYELSYDEAQKHPEIKQFFGEKYGSQVRVIDIDFSKELCGGTHVKRLGTIGLFRILKESSIAAGVRRIEAVCGKAAEEFMYKQEDFGLKSASLLKATLPTLPEKLEALLEEHKDIQLTVKTLKRSALRQLADTLATQKKKIKEIPFLAAIVNVDTGELAPLAEDLLVRMHSAIILLGTKEKEKCHLFAKVSPDLVQKGVSAQALIKEIAPLVQGSGGGKADSAQAGGKDPAQLERALAHAENFLQR